MKKNPIVKNKFDKYRMNNLWIDNINNIDFFDKKKNNICQKEREWKEYVKLVDSILESMDKESSELLKEVYIYQRDFKDLYISQSTFYWKHKRAVKEFLDYFALS